MPDPGAQGLGRSQTVCSRGLGHRVSRPATAEPPGNPFQGRLSAPPQGASAQEGLGTACPAFKAFHVPKGSRGPPAYSLGRETWKPSIAAGQKMEPESVDSSVSLIAQTPGRDKLWALLLSLPSSPRSLCQREEECGLSAQPKEHTS